MERTKGTDTLIVVTADHSHTLSMAGYPQRGDPILGLIEGSFGETGPQKGPALDLTQHPYTTLAYANGPGYPGASDVEPEGRRCSRTARRARRSRSA